ncbi:MAG: zinc-binding dehydrogenase [Chloroflexota bacterium]
MLALVAAPTALAKVELRDVPEPSPSPGEALVAVRAISLNRGEVNRTMQAEDGWRPGWDVAGDVIQAARDGSGPSAGARVVGLLPEGGWCERVAVPTAHLSAIPDHCSYAAAAALPVAGLTALRGLGVAGRLLGKRVLVTGGAGGVGRFAIQLGKLAGAEVTAVVGRPERGAGLAELGAASVIVGIDAAEGPYDLILESVGGASLARAMTLVGRGGTVVTLGNSSREQTTFEPRDFFFAGGRLYGFHLVLHEIVTTPAAADLGYLARLVADGQLDPQVAAEGSWREAGPLLEALLDRRVDGKAVLHLD